MRAPRLTTNRLFFGLCIVISYACFSQYEFVTSHSLAEANFWRTFGFLWPFSITFLTHFSIVFSQQRTRLWHIVILFFGYLPALFFSVELLVDQSSISTAVDKGWYWGIDIRSNSAHLVSRGISIWAFLMTTTATLLCLRRLKRIWKHPAERKRTLFVFIGVFTTVFVSILNYAVLAPNGVIAPDLATYGFTVGCFFLGYTAFKHRLFDLNVAAAADQIIAAITDLLLFLEEDGTILFANSAAADAIGLTVENLRGRNCKQFFNPETRNIFSDRISETLRENKSSPAIHAGFIRNKRGSASYSFTITPFNDQGTNERGVICIGRDLTEQERVSELESQLQQAQKLEAIGRLAGGVAHDYNNMLGAISGYADMIKKRVDPENTKVIAYSEKILSAATRASDLTAKLLTFARKGKIETTIIDIHPIIDELVSMLTHTIQKTIIISKQLDADPATVEGDASQLQNVLLNLALNARDAMPNGGRLNVTTALKKFDSPKVDRGLFGTMIGEYVVVSISDTGVGMDKETKEKIFEPFFTTKNPGKGTGLGLASVFGIIKDHRGTIEVESWPGAGSTFQLYLPLCRRTPAAEESIPETQIHKPGSGHILVIDDEELLRDACREMLETMNYKVTTASGCAEACDILKLNPQQFSCIILDMNMTDIGGYECYHNIRKINPGVPVIISSGYALNDEIQKLLREGANGFIQKPFSANKLAKAIKKVLQG